MKKYKRQSTTFLAIISLLVWSSSLTAQSEEDHPIDIEMEVAMERDASTAGQTEAMGKALKKWDALMNRCYRKLMEGLDPETEKSLIESQRQWIVWRDKEIDFVDRFHEKLQGTMYVPMQAFRRMNITRQRAIQLERLADMVEDRI